jgi:hypothetical protein
MFGPKTEKKVHKSFESDNLSFNIGDKQEYKYIKPVEPKPFNFKELEEKTKSNVSYGNNFYTRYTENKINPPKKSNIPQPEFKHSWKQSSENVPIKKSQNYEAFTTFN